MIAAMLTMTVMTLVMAVALMFAAEIGWLIVEPRALPTACHPADRPAPP